jgi:AcrR family transcriptional regulator
VQPETSSVRQQKKYATRRALRKATLDLGLLHGLNKVHIDDIAARAGVSPRTFFNYFDAKEDAAVIDVPEFTEMELDELARGSSGDSVFDDLRKLFGRSLERSQAHGQEIDAYLRLHQQNPALVARQLTRFAEFEGTLARVLAARLPAATALQTEVLAGACMVASRVALQHWGRDSALQDLDHRIQEAFTTLRPTFTALG